jgi:TPR repeat protein
MSSEHLIKKMQAFEESYLSAIKEGFFTREGLNWSYKRAILYVHGFHNEKDYKKAARFFLEEPTQQEHILERFEDDYIEKDYKKIVRKTLQLLEQAAQQGHILAQAELACCYANGFDGEGINSAEAVRLYKLAADKGLAIAQCELGFQYSLGRGVEKDSKKAAQLYNLAAEQGYAEAQYNLARLYEVGDGVEEDSKQAIQLYNLAAEQGHKEAQYELGRRYEDGIGVVADLEEAIRLYKLAAEQEHVKAQYQLGECYEQGRGVEKDLKEAASLYSKANKDGPRYGHAGAQYKFDALCPPPEVKVSVAKNPSAFVYNSSSKSITPAAGTIDSLTSTISPMLGATKEAEK